MTFVQKPLKSFSNLTIAFKLQMTNLNSGNVATQQHHIHTQHHQAHQSQPLHQQLTPSSQQQQPSQPSHVQHHEGTTSTPGIIVLNNISQPNGSNPSCANRNISVSAQSGCPVHQNLPVTSNGISGVAPTTTSIEILDSEDSSSREKTPMCLVNELARYNKVGTSYTQTSLLQ